jgi:hypothetical protein
MNLLNKSIIKANYSHLNKFQKAEDQKNTDTETIKKDEST